MADDKDSKEELFQKTAEADESPDSAEAAAPLSAPDPAPRVEEPPPGAPEPKAEKPRPPSRAPVLAGALIIGALAGFGGAFGLRYFDSLQGPDSTDRVDELNARAAELEHKAEASESEFAALKTRLAAAESSAGKAAASAGAALDELHQSLAARPEPAPASAASPSSPASPEIKIPDIAPIESKLETFEKKLGALQAALATPKVDPKAQQDREAADQKAQALSAAHSTGLVAASLVQVIGRGEPFSDEVGALENLGVSPAKLAPLRATAKTGVATVGDLAEQFAAIAPSLDAPEAPKQDEGLLDRLARDASNLVRIHRAGDPHDADISGRIAAIESALARQNVAKAYAAWLQLPDDARAKSAKWGEAAKGRLDAIQAASAIEADAVATVGKPKS